MNGGELYTTDFTSHPIARLKFGWCATITHLKILNLKLRRVVIAHGGFLPVQAWDT